MTIFPWNFQRYSIVYLEINIKFNSSMRRFFDFSIHTRISQEYSAKGDGWGGNVILVNRIIIIGVGESELSGEIMTITQTEVNERLAGQSQFRGRSVALFTLVTCMDLLKLNKMNTSNTPSSFCGSSLLIKAKHSYQEQIKWVLRRATARISLGALLIVRPPTLR